MGGTLALRVSAPFPSKGSEERDRTAATSMQRVGSVDRQINLVADQHTRPKLRVKLKFKDHDDGKRRVLRTFIIFSQKLLCDGSSAGGYQYPGSPCPVEWV